MKVRSVREVTLNMCISKTLVFRILYGVLQLYPYNFKLFQQLLKDDAAKRMTFANWALLEFEENLQ